VTTDPAEKLGAVAAAIATRFETIAGATVYPYEPLGRALSPPCITIGACDFERSGVEEPDSQLGSDDWILTYAITLYVALFEPEKGFADAREFVGRAIAAIDADQKLGGEVLEAKLTSGDMGFNDEDAQRRLVVVECELEALALMPR
jgi:hypothetical protein